MAETFTPDKLIFDGDGIVTDTGTLISGQNLTRGTVVGKITASGKLTKSLSASSDGSEVPFAILSHDLDASGGDAPCIVYVAGTFNTNGMTIGTAHTVASIKAGLRDKGIFLKTAVAA